MICISLYIQDRSHIQFDISEVSFAKKNYFEKVSIVGHPLVMFDIDVQAYFTVKSSLVDLRIIDTS